MTTRQKIEGWIQEKIEALRSKGVTEADMQEEAFEELLTDNISARHFSEFRSDPELQKEILGAMLKHASPEILREFASKLRAAWSETLPWVNSNDKLRGGEEDENHP
jgi:hypothetical protein